ncbi:TetR family transcriptional regulator [Mycobacterium sp. E1747]|uniref:TetR family transcriptional regulator n=1 Tax=Mycobacterium sp. E1747 TaxID=1834128 RepID=UPI000800BE92|nr:TetR family transcriptional regulator [Mycobacterium sp. E1747]OBH13390.1 transcriptional regulator [Mycobacterium sp. E1747]
MPRTDIAGAAIRGARLEAGLTVRDLARRMRLSPATISAVENGKTGLTVGRLHDFASALNIPVTRLLEPAGRARDLPRQPIVADPGQTTGDWRRFSPLPIDPVLAGAIDSFTETGYHGTTMRSLASRTGLSVPGIYHYYKDKQQLLVRILDLTMDELHWRVDAARRDAADSRDEIALIVESLALFHTHRRELAFIGASEMRSLTGANRRRIASSRNRLQHILDDAIDRALADGQLNTGDARAAGRAIATMCTSLPQWFRAGGTASPEDIATVYARFALMLLGASIDRL